jgi:thymidylate synthase ThyX
MESHIVVPIEITGGKVVILNTNSTISQEDMAMLQALYSRDPRSIEEHLSRVGSLPPGGGSSQKVLPPGGGSSQKKSFMQTYYVGYGHQSIGDCGYVTFFIEGISIIAAKAIQDTRLYSGQEVSTRYVDYSKQRFLFGGEYGEKLRAFYVKSFPLVQEFLSTSNPTATKAAIKAATFDVLRGFLPAGAETSCSWTTNIRQANDHLMWLRSHPLEEVRCIADSLTKALKIYAPSSVTDENKRVPPEWVILKIEGSPMDPERSHAGGLEVSLKKDPVLLNRRNPKDLIPNVADIIGTVCYDVNMDYGSFRDLQRHRSIIQNNPLPSKHLGFENWYVERLPEELKEEARLLVSEAPLNVYETPMGFKVQARGLGGLGSMIYISELRSAPTVHPTLQAFAKRLGHEIEHHGVVVHYQKGEVVHLSNRRGEQTITLKE